VVALFDPGEKDERGGCESTLQKLRQADGGAGIDEARARRQR
jgi:hypothetical protein